MHDITRFINGFKKFQKEYFCGNSNLFDVLKNEQSPKTLVISCVDSRVDPLMLTGSKPGDLLVVRNVANLVPPYEPEGGMHGVSAALEHAVTIMNVEHVIVLGHSCCGGIKALMTMDEGADDGAENGTGSTEFLGKWVKIADQAKRQTLETLADKPAEKQQHACEHASILVSLENLLTFPWIKQRVEAGTLYLHGWYFDMEQGALHSYLPESGAFEPLAQPCL